MSKSRQGMRGGSFPQGKVAKIKTSVSIDADILAATRSRVGRRGLSGEVERLLRAESERVALASDRRARNER